MPVLSLSAALKVLILAGGISPAENHHSHLVHVQAVQQSLSARGLSPDQIALFWAGGADGAPDRHVRSEAPPADLWLIEGTRLAQLTDPGPALEVTALPGARPAQREAIRGWLEAQRGEWAPGDTLLVAVTDHGQPDEAGGHNTLINLWGEDELWSVRDVLEDLRLVPGSVRVVFWASQCFSGGFAQLRERPNTCAAVSTTPDRVAYGCYPDLMERPDVGHFMQLLAGLERTQSLAEAADWALFADDTPDVPHLSSDAFLFEHFLEAAQAVGAPFETYLDERLARAEQQSEDQRKIAQLCERFGLGALSSHRQVLDLVARLGAQRQRLSGWRAHYQRSVQASANDLAAKTAMQTPKLQGRGQRLVARGRALDAVRGLLKKQSALAQDLERIRARIEAIDALLEQIDVQEAAAMRVGYLQTRLAASVDLQIEARAQWQTLRQCEEAPLWPAVEADAQADAQAMDAQKGAPSGSAQVAPPEAQGEPEPAFERLPSVDRLAADVAALAPGWLGVEFRDLPRYRGVELLAVHPASPALAAGLQPKDRVLALGEQKIERLEGFRQTALLAPPGRPLQVEVQRDGGSHTYTLYPVAPPVLPAPPQIGQLVPALPLVPLEASRPLPAIGEGRPVLLFFWATWCAPCKAAVPDVQRFAQAQGAQVIAITREDRATVQRFLKGRDALDWPFPVALDEAEEAHRLLTDEQTPAFALISAGRVLEGWGVGYDGDLPEGLVQPRPSVKVGP